MGILERDPEATAATLTRWLAEVAGVAEPAVTGVSIPGSTGWSNETVLFDATWGDGDGDDGGRGAWWRGSPRRATRSSPTRRSCASTR